MGDFNGETDYLESDILEQEEYALRDVWKAKGLCGDEGERRGGKRKRKSYNFANDEMRHVWDDDVDPMFQSPYTHYLRELAKRTKKGRGRRRGRQLKGVGEDVSVRVPWDHDLEAWNKFVYQGGENE